MLKILPPCWEEEPWTIILGSLQVAAWRHTHDRVDHFSQAQHNRTALNNYKRLKITIASESQQPDALNARKPI